MEEIMKKIIFTLFVILSVTLSTFSVCFADVTNSNNIAEFISPCSDMPRPPVNVG